jgi:[acyl-carrier-protein] S-malonyltransferase
MTKLAFVFPGQGSQSVGMLADLAAEFPVVLDVFAQASEIFGRDLWELSQNGSQDELSSTVVTQPLMLAADIAVWRVWQQQSGVLPEIMAGHSLGEYSALVSAGALSFSDAMHLVIARSKAMQGAVPEGAGAMVAVIGLDEQGVTDLCAKASDAGRIMPANFNAPGQVVVAGDTAAADLLVSMAKEAGAKMAKKLAMSVPSHCELMEPAVSLLKAALDKVEIMPTKIPVLSNVSAEVYSSASDIYDGLLNQIIAPVRWVEISNKIAQSGVEWILECGPAKVLCGLAKRTIKQIPATAIGSPEQMAMVLKELSGDDL